METTATPEANDDGDVAKCVKVKHPQVFWRPPPSNQDDGDTPPPTPSLDMTAKKDDIAPSLDDLRFTETEAALDQWKQRVQSDPRRILEAQLDRWQSNNGPAKPAANDSDGDDEDDDAEEMFVARQRHYLKQRK
ncbi:hypothetical protein SPRG_19072 [Saprolegnia parasitica CBS 223.65]|uniref:Uncharacterized protein n=1 Tax=Saprolegnia parasitica (strain CBS 223.65) TaxID=695850 RepID=A0A067CYB8_SAPPC|nr:hypothetical protein SPRG_19072 [Saprolegnia parasitica CBS 223.65]KDO34235.1 hypothetical protein SPRG_19072 [Saprolegnia parasitica CBS 223.65]|eukprot:XP_012195268.1 hypothetical protein SPRG_19072 [Saprolegnia parasitica CBS 223.65]